MASGDVECLGQVLDLGFTANCCVNIGTKHAGDLNSSKSYTATTAVNEN